MASIKPLLDVKTAVPRPLLGPQIANDIADGASLDAIAVMDDAVEQRRGHLGIAEHGRLLAEGEVRGDDDDAGALIELADEVEQQLSSRACEWLRSKLVEQYQVEPRQLRR